MEDNKTQKFRCEWGNISEIYKLYHDTEWGKPLHNDRQLFEFLVLESFQAGLSWITILKKRENFRKAFDNFDPTRVALYSEEKISELMVDSGIIRNLLKIKSSINNAARFIEVQKEFGSFDKYIWQFVGFKPIINRWKNFSEMPPKTPLSDIISKDLKKRGFKFIGSTIVYSFMQATGMVNDHLTGCFRYEEVNKD